MRVFLHRLLVASQWGASLLLASACGADVESAPGAPGPAAPAQNLEPAPAPACYGPVYDDDFGYHGQCCDITLCTAPVNGVCPGANEVVLEVLSSDPGRRNTIAVSEVVIGTPAG